jgi:hypothetical protein
MTFPTPEEELDRKVIEEVERLEMLRVRKVISDDQYASAMLAIWNVAAGLVPKETMEILTMTGKETRQVVCNEAETLLPKDQSKKAVRIVRHGAIVTVKVGTFDESLEAWIVKVSVYDFSPEVDGYEKASKKYIAILQSLMTKGYEPI